MVAVPSLDKLSKAYYGFRCCKPKAEGALATLTIFEASLLGLLPMASGKLCASSRALSLINVLKLLFLFVEAQSATQESIQPFQSPSS
jgi:pantothenate kinase-related protein Tda10